MLFRSRFPSFLQRQREVSLKGHGIRSIRNLFNVWVGKFTTDAVYSFFPAHSFRQRQLTSVMLRAIDFFIDIIPEAKTDYCGN